jgi:hypothetical protein
VPRILAAQLNVQAADWCQPFGSPPELIGHDDVGVWVIRTSGPISGQIVCTVPRAPAAGGGPATFHINGDNSVGASTSCTLSSWGERHNLKASRSFTTTASRYDEVQTFAAAEMDSAGFITLTCILPPRQGGILRGITSLP